MVGFAGAELADLPLWRRAHSFSGLGSSKLSFYRLSARTDMVSFANLKLTTFPWCTAEAVIHIIGYCDQENLQTSTTMCSHSSQKDPLTQGSWSTFPEDPEGVLLVERGRLDAVSPLSGHCLKQ